MARFLIGLIIGLAVGYIGISYWLQETDEMLEEDDLIEIDQIPLPADPI